MATELIITIGQERYDKIILLLNSIEYYEVNYPINRFLEETDRQAMLTGIIKRMQSIASEAKEL